MLLKKIDLIVSIDSTTSNIYKVSFYATTIPEWKSLPAEVIDQPSVDASRPVWCLCLSIVIELHSFFLFFFFFLSAVMGKSLCRLHI